MWSLESIESGTLLVDFLLLDASIQVLDLTFDPLRDFDLEAGRQPVTKFVTLSLQVNTRRTAPSSGVKSGADAISNTLELSVSVQQFPSQLPT